MIETRILVTASRDWSNALLCSEALIAVALEFPADTYTLIEGEALGGDQMARNFGLDWGWKIEPHPVSSEDWAAYPRIAGFLRNQVMVDSGADVCVALIMPCTKPTHKDRPPHDSHGTDDCMRRARKADIPVREVRPA